MTEGRVTTKAELLAELEDAWAALNAGLDRLTEEQLTTAADPQGWTVKDHVVHLTAWERSALFFLQGQPRHVGLGVDEAVYLSGKDDEINAVIYRQRHGLPLAEALAEFRDVHDQLLNALQPLTETELQRPYRHYLPEEPGLGDGPRALDVVNGNSAHHFVEHLVWIEALAG